MYNFFKMLVLFSPHPPSILLSLLLSLSPISIFPHTHLPTPSCQLQFELVSVGEKDVSSITGTIKTHNGTLTNSPHPCGAIFVEQYSVGAKMLWILLKIWHLDLKIEALVPGSV